jgi:hypothetical protein
MAGRYSQGIQGETTEFQSIALSAIPRIGSKHDDLQDPVVRAMGARKKGLGDKALCQAVEEMSAGLFEASLGGNLFKKRVARPRQARRVPHDWSRPI